MRVIQQAGITAAGRIIVPAGWTAHVFEIEPEALAYEAYEGALGSRVKVHKTFNAVFTAGWLKGLRSSIRHQALRYAERYPELVTPEGLLGFDPEELQRYYLPQSRSGLAGMDDALEAMADAARF